MGVSNEYISSCPAPTHISHEILSKAAIEFQDIQKDSALAQVMIAAMNDRDKLRACRTIH